VNTTRWLVDEDPVETAAFGWSRDRKRFREVEEGIAFHLRFPSGLIVQALASWGSALASSIEVHGEKGWATLSPAFAFEEERRLAGKVSGQWFVREFQAIDEFALELDAFSGCIRDNLTPSPDGVQGMRDVVILDAIYRAARLGRPVAIKYPPTTIERRKS
jgi:predicted dehydrogenase